jgi:hypothetical protein
VLSPLSIFSQTRCRGAPETCQTQKMRAIGRLVFAILDTSKSQEKPIAKPLPRGWQAPSVWQRTRVWLGVDFGMRKFTGLLAYPAAMLLLRRLLSEKAPWLHGLWCAGHVGRTTEVRKGR